MCIRDRSQPPSTNNPPTHTTKQWKNPLQLFQDILYLNLAEEGEHYTETYEDIKKSKSSQLKAQFITNI